MLNQKDNKYISLKEFINQELASDEQLKRQYEESSLQLDVAKQILYWRVKRQLSQAELAELCGTKQERISRVENLGEISSISFLQRIAKALNLCLKFVFHNGESIILADYCGRAPSERLSLDIAKILTAYRKSKGLSQRELGELVGTQQSAISRLEKGVVLPTLRRLFVITRALNVTVDIYLEPIEIYEFSDFHSIATPQIQIYAKPGELRSSPLLHQFARPLT